MQNEEKNYMKTIETIGVVALKENDVLLVEHTDYAGLPTGSYGLPAGTRRKSESEIAAGRREFNQESGYSTRNIYLQQLPTTYTAVMIRKNKEVLMSMKVFYCRKLRGVLKNSNETIPCWMPIKNLSTINLLPNVLNAINEALDLKNRT